MNLTYGSVCSGIEAASAAWEGLGWKPTWFAEIEQFPASVLAHRYPLVPNLGDMTQIKHYVDMDEVTTPDVLVGGTPCQAFSVAGMRGSLVDHRGQLTIAFVHLADAIDRKREEYERKPAIIVWENVPGVLSTGDNAFGCFIAAISGADAELHPPTSKRGKRLKWPDAGCVVGPKRTVAWRVLDAQYFGLAQRRRRVFVIASARSDFNPAQSLFEFDGVCRDTPPSRAAGEGITHTIAGCLAASGRGVSRTGEPRGQDPVVACAAVDITHTLRGEGFDASEDGTGRGTPLVPVVMAHGQGGAEVAFNRSPTLTCNHEAPIVVDTTQVTSPGNYSKPKPGDPCHPLAAHAHPSLLALTHLVRRLTPRECERLQGFLDDWTLIRDKTKDGPRYKAVGNSMAVPVMRWLGRRIEFALLRPWNDLEL